jgi:hypothetical protein
MISPQKICVRLATHAWVPWLLVAAIYLLGALIFTYPTVLNMDSALAGEDSQVNQDSDVLETTWGIWWWQHALFDLHQSPIQLSTLNHPTGQTYPLYWFMSQVFLFAAPVARLTSPIFAYNFVILASFVLCGLAGYAMCLEITADRLASLVGGFIWAFFPTRTTNVLGGHLQFTFLFSIPLAALCLLRLLRAPSWRKACLAAGSLCLACTLHPAHIPYVVAPLVVVLLAFSIGYERRSWGRKKVLAVGIALGLAALGVAALLLPLLASYQQENAAYEVRSVYTAGAGADLFGYFTPAATHPLIRSTPLAGWAQNISVPYERVVYAGWLPLMLALTGARASGLKGRPWVWLALGGALFSLGPLLRVGGNFATVVLSGTTHEIVLPYALLANLPVLRWSAQPARLSMLDLGSVTVGP